MSQEVSDTLDAIEFYLKLMSEIRYYDKAYENGYKNAVGEIRSIIRELRKENRND